MKALKVALAGLALATTIGAATTSAEARYYGYGWGGHHRHFHHHHYRVYGGGCYWTTKRVYNYYYGWTWRSVRVCY